MWPTDQEGVLRTGQAPRVRWPRRPAETGTCKAGASKSRKELGSQPSRELFLLLECSLHGFWNNWLA